MELRCLPWLVLLLIGGLGAGCNKSKSESAPPPTSTPIPTIERVPPDLADRVLAKVGDRTITLGDYAAALDRMDRFERLRYQTPDRRRALLDELINTELLAREAERRGLDKKPETEVYLTQLLRDEARRRLRAEQPELTDLPEAEVKAYYAEHRDEFRDPERRRVAVLAVRSRPLAERLLTELRTADRETWGKAVREHSVLKRGTGDEALPLDLEGDLGLVSAPNEPRGDNPKVPALVRQAVFEIPEPDQLATQVVADGGMFYLVRLVARSPARARSLDEADTNIRARLLRSRLQAAEAQLQSRLEKEVPVTINEAVIEQIKRDVP